MNLHWQYQSRAEPILPPAAPTIDLWEPSMADRVESQPDTHAQSFESFVYAPEPAATPSASSWIGLSAPPIRTSVDPSIYDTGASQPTRVQPQAPIDWISAPGHPAPAAIQADHLYPSFSITIVPPASSAEPIRWLPEMDLYPLSAAGTASYSTNADLPLPWTAPAITATLYYEHFMKRPY